MIPIDCFSEIKTKSNIGCISISGIFKSGILIKEALQGKLF